MFQECKFDKNCDLCEVDQFGFVDLSKSINEGFVPNDLSTVADSFDGVDIDPESIVGKPADVFEAMRLQDNIAEDIKKQSSAKDEN